MGWLAFFLEGVERVANDAAAVSRAVVELREAHRALIVDRFGRTAANGLRILEQLYSLPLINVKRVRELTGVSFETANQLVTRFIEHGILSEITGQSRNRQFRYHAYVDLFAARR
jgi:hypothetical protein